MRLLLLILTSLLHLHLLACDPEITPVDPLCADAGVITLVAATEGGVWSGPGIVDPDLGLFDPAEAGDGEHLITYSICDNTDEITLTVLPVTLISLPSPDAVCFDQELVTLPDAGAEGSWSGPGIVDASGLFSPSDAGGPGEYTLTFTTADDCPAEATTTIEVSGAPFIFVEPEVEINLGESIELQVAGDNGTYNWTPTDGLSCTDCQNPEASPESTTSYLVTLTNAAGCTNSAAVTVNVESSYTLYLPNIFSPNGDNSNDRYRARGTPLNGFKMQVFNRYGQIVYESEDQSEGWDGTSNGKQLPPGAYIVQVSGFAPAGGMINEAVNLTLIR